jgi:adenylate cyclase
VSDAASEQTILYLESLGADRAALPDNPGDLVAVAFDLAFDRGSELSMGDIAEICEVDVSTVQAMYRSLGVTVRSDARLFTPDDVDLVRTLVVAVEGPLEQEEGRQILRVAARALTTIAEAAVAEVRQGVESRHQSIDDGVRQSVRMGELGIQLGRGLSAGFRHHLRQAVERQRLGQQGVQERELIRVAIGFVDLVGFTGLTARLPVGRLVDLVNSLEQRSAELAAIHDVRVVKIIGDEVMFVALDAKAACAFALDLVAAFGEDEVVPRGGVVFGEVLFRHGDYYGPVVNRASRIADLAVPSEILVDASLAETFGVSAQPAGRRLLRGFDDPIEVFALE